MSKFKRFREYLDQKDKLQEKPIISLTGDTSPDGTPRPPKAVTKGKNWSSNVPNENPTPYSAAGVSDQKKNIDKGLGNIGDKNLIYKPDTIDKEPTDKKTNNFSFPKEKVSSVWGQSESFIEKTKNMSIKEFINLIQSEMNIGENKTIPTIHAQETGNIIPDPIQAIKFISYLTNKNDKLMETLVVEIKRLGGLEKLVECALEYKDSYTQIAKSLTNENKGLSNSRRLAKSLTEVTAPPVADTEGSFKEKKKKKGRKAGSIDGNQLDMKNSDITATTMKTVEHNIVKALKEEYLI